jgi:hypothetical protein
VRFIAKSARKGSDSVESFLATSESVLRSTRIHIIGSLDSWPSGKRNSPQSATERFVALCSTIKPADVCLANRLRSGKRRGDHSPIFILQLSRIGVGLGRIEQKFTELYAKTKVDEVIYMIKELVSSDKI